MFLLRRPTPERLSRVLDEVSAASFTYDEVGGTRAAAWRDGDLATLPSGYRHEHRWAILGQEGAAFDRAVEAMRGWRMHRGQGFVVVPGDPPIAEGTTVVSAIPSPPLHVVAACRIVWVVDEPDRFGFAYGTLPAHPSRGEEAFVVERLPGGRVEARVTAFSTPGHPLVRLAGPLAARQQARATVGYLDVLQAEA